MIPSKRSFFQKSEKGCLFLSTRDRSVNCSDEDEFGDDFDGIRNRTIIEMLYTTGMRRAQLTPDCATLMWISAGLQ